jgi:hypothetical protein
MLSNQPDNRQPDGTSEPGTWRPPSFTPGSAPLPQPPNPDYPPTSEFPATPTDQFPPPAYTPPGYAPPEYGQSGYAPPEYAQSGYPPPEYAQSGYPPPGYAPPGHQPQQPHPGPPGRPPRKSKLPIVAVLVAITLLLCGGVATAGVLIARNVADRAERAVDALPDLPSAAPQLPDLPSNAPQIPDLPTELPSLPAGPGLDSRQISVTYEVTGEGKASQILYVEKLGDSPKRIENVDLPWKFSTKMETPALVSVVAMRIGTSEGTISCRALVDGAEVKQRTSSASNVATASCTHFAID